jgi:hypothetical protein
MLVDGVPATSGDWSALLAVPGVDSIHEVQVVRNSYDVQFGKSGGGVVSLVSKSGSQDYHGTIFEFLRNDHLDANSWVQNRAGRQKTTFQRSQFGGNFSGPLWKGKKLYFFAGYDGVREGTPAPYSTTVPTDLQRRGDFSQTRNADGNRSVIHNPFTTRPNPNGAGFVRDPFPENRIPESLFDPVGARDRALSRAQHFGQPRYRRPELLRHGKIRHSPEPRRPPRGLGQERKAHDLWACHQDSVRADRSHVLRQRG